MVYTLDLASSSTNVDVIKEKWNRNGISIPFLLDVIYLHFDLTRPNESGPKYPLDNDINGP